MWDAAFLVLLLSSGAASVGPLQSQARPQIDAAFPFAYASPRSEAFGEFFCWWVTFAPRATARPICAMQIRPEPSLAKENRNINYFKGLLPKCSFCHVERSRDISCCWKFLK
jgi:hypothetical protein